MSKTEEVHKVDNNERADSSDPKLKAKYYNRELAGLHVSWSSSSNGWSTRA